MPLSYPLHLRQTSLGMICTTLIALHAIDGVATEIQIQRRDNVYVATVAGSLATPYSATSAADVLQHAINHADTVSLASGTYLLDKPVKLRSGVTVTGSGRGTELRMAPGHASGVALLLKGIDAACVRDLAITSIGSPDAKVGVALDDAGDCTIQNLLVYGFSEYGVLLSNGVYLSRVLDCQLADCRRAAVCCRMLAEGGRGGDYVPNSISGCSAYGGGVGFEADHALVVNFRGDTAYQTKNSGFYLHDSSNSALLTGCRTYQIETDAVVVEDSHEVNITGNIFCWHRGHGIVLRGVAWGTVTGNNVIDTGVRNATLRDGIVLEQNTRGLQVSGNAIFNWGGQVPMRYGILERGDCHNNLLLANNINFCTRGGVRSEGDGSIAANNLESTQRAYLGMGREPPFPDFTRDRLELFLKEIEERYKQ